MADHLKPTITSTYSNFVTEMDARFDDLAVGLDPAVTSATNVPSNAISWSSASNKWQKFNGTSWGDLSALYSISISGNAGSVTNGVYTSSTYANPTWITSLAGSKITGDISGNSGSATRLATPRNINGVTFDGTAAIGINLNTSVTFNSAGTGGASGTTFNGGSAATISYNTIGAPSTTGANASGTWGISITGNAASVTNGVYNNGGTYGINISGNAASVTNGVYNNSGTYSINITGNAGYATNAGNASTVTNGVYNNGGTYGINISGNSNTVTNLNNSQVLSAIAVSSTGSVGTYAFLQGTFAPGPTNPNIDPGTTYAGSSLRFAGVNQVANSPIPSGTWRCMGRGYYSTTDGYGNVTYGPTTTVWLRIS